MNDYQASIIALLPDVRRWARKFSPDDEYISLAETALCEHAPKWSPETGVSIKTFIYREVHRRMKRFRAQSMITNVPDMMNRIPAPPQAAVTEAIPEKYHRVFDMYYGRGMSVRAIAKQEHLPRRIIKLQLAAIRRTMKEAYHA